MKRLVMLSAALALLLTAAGLGQRPGRAESLMPANGLPGARVAVKRIALAASKVTLGVGETFDLEAVALGAGGEAAGGVLRYASGNASVVAVDADGVVTGVKRGKTRVTVIAEGGVKAVCTVTVKAAPTDVSAVLAAPKLTVGRRTRLKVTLSRSSASALRYSDYDPGVVSVSSAGWVSAVGPGETVITVSTFNGLEARCVARVFEAGCRQTDIVAHRGGAGDWLENSLEAFRNAASSGADAVEIDVRSTRDGAQMVHHDAAFAARGKRWVIEALTFAEIRALDADICTLDEALEVIAAAGLGLQLELKDSADPEACARIVAERGMERRTCFIAFDFDALRAVRAALPGASIGLLLRRPPRDIERIIAELKPNVIAQSARCLRRDEMVRWQSRGLRVGAWTVNTAEELRLYAELGVDFLTTDQPEVGVEVLELLRQ